MNEEELVNQLELPDRHLQANEKKFYFGKISAIVSDLIQHDFNKLIQILYRLDIDELKLKQSLQQNTGIDASFVITEMIMERQIKKIESRNAFKKKPDIPEDEKW